MSDVAESIIGNSITAVTVVTGMGIAAKWLAGKVNAKDKAIADITDRSLKTITDIQARSQKALSDNTIALARVAEHLDALSRNGCKPLLEAVELLKERNEEKQR